MAIPHFSHPSFSTLTSSAYPALNFLFSPQLRTVCVAQLLLEVGPILKGGQPTRNHIIKETRFTLSYQLLNFNSSPTRDRNLYHFHVRMLSSLSLHKSPHAVTVPASSWAAALLCSEALFPWAHQPPLALPEKFPEPCLVREVRYVYPIEVQSLLSLLFSAC